MKHPPHASESRAVTTTKTTPPTKAPASTAPRMTHLRGDPTAPDVPHNEINGIYECCPQPTAARSRGWHEAAQGKRPPRFFRSWFLDSVGTLRITATATATVTGHGSSADRPCASAFRTMRISSAVPSPWPWPWPWPCPCPDSSCDPWRLVTCPRHVLRVPAAIQMDPLRRHLEDPIRQRAEKLPIVRHEEHGSLERGERFDQHLLGGHVEVIRRLVEHKKV